MADDGVFAVKEKVADASFVVPLTCRYVYAGEDVSVVDADSA